MNVETIPEEAIEKVKIRNYEIEDRNIENNVKVVIHINEDHELAEEVNNNVIEINAGIFNAVELDNVREKISEE
jgi:hypothetical protein